MKLLVLGGSYFCGRVFAMEAAKIHDVTVVNRGTYSMASFGVKELRDDRRNDGFLKECEGDFDGVVDFHGYRQGDIRKVLQNLPGRIGQYIFISTCDVYERGVKGFKGEEVPLETRVFEGEAGDYILGKTTLEQEGRRECESRGIAWTSLRPVFIYGPYNYAPRESLFIQMMVQKQLLPRITDADGQFQMVYVKDVADAVLKCLGNERAYGQAYNLSGDEVLDYAAFAEGLALAAEETTPGWGRLYPMTGAEFAALGAELPFPRSMEETELYANEKSKSQLGMEYTGFAEGIGRTYRAFRSVYEGQAGKE